MAKDFWANSGTRLALLVVAGITVATVGVTISKAIETTDKPKLPQKGIELKGNIVTPTLSSEIGGQERTQKIKNPGKCIITLFGKRYDVTEPNKDGGNTDMFDCGKDMTSIYSAKYGTDVTAMAGYLVDQPQPSPTNSPPTMVMATPTLAKKEGSSNDSYKFEDDDDEREDEEHEDRYEEKEEEKEEEKSHETEKKDELEER